MKLRSLLKLALAAAALSAGPAWPASTPEQPLAVALDNFSFSPKTIELVHGQAYALTLANRASGGHNFVAPEFFAAARLDPAGRAQIRKGGIEVPGGESRTVHFVAPAAGRYSLRCTHTLHSAFGMGGPSSFRNAGRARPLELMNLCP